VQAEWLWLPSKLSRLYVQHPVLAHGSYVRRQDFHICDPLMLFRGDNQSLAPADITDTDTVQLATLRILSIASSSQPITVTHAGKSSAACMLTAVSSPLRSGAPL